MLPAPPRTPDAVGVGRCGVFLSASFSSCGGTRGPGTTPVCCGMDGHCLCYLKPLCSSWRARSPAPGLTTTTTSARNRYRRHGNTRNTFPAKISVHEQRGKGESWQPRILLSLPPSSLFSSLEFRGKKSNDIRGEKRVFCDN